MTIAMTTATKAADAHSTLLPTRTVMVTVRDGTEIAVALYLPDGDGPWPALFAASPYRYDNNIVPEVPCFLWRETGPIDWYVHQHGYAFVHMDVRGSGNSGGEFCFLGTAEQQDYYDVIQWIAEQPWSTGKIGGVGQSYYAMAQWLAACLNPPNLSCIAAFDGFTDPYRCSIYTGGIPGDFFHLWYNQVMRVVNASPARGEPRHVPYDLSAAIRQHPLYDSYWRERTALERIHESRVPLLSVGVLSKMDLHLNGNIMGYQAHGGDKKLLLIAAANIFEAVGVYAQPEYHEKWLLPFYDYHLKGEQNGYQEIAPVRYFVRNTSEVRTADRWPPKPVSVRTLYLSPEHSCSVVSLNDGSLVESLPDTPASTDNHFPNPGWLWGVVGLGERLAPDPVRRVLTYTSAPLTEDLVIVGPIKLVLHLSSSNLDADVLVKLSEQYERDGDGQPQSAIISKGWLRASHRSVDPAKSSDMAPYHPHDHVEPLVPGEVYELEIAIMPTACRIEAGRRLRLELANGDSALTDQIFTHEYQLFKIGTDTVHHGGAHASRLLLPVAE